MGDPKVDDTEDDWTLDVPVTLEPVTLEPVTLDTRDATLAAYEVEHADLRALLSEARDALGAVSPGQWLSDKQIDAVNAVRRRIGERLARSR